MNYTSLRSSENVITLLFVFYRAIQRNQSEIRLNIFCDKLVKLAFYLEGRYLKDYECRFLEKVEDDIKCFIENSSHDCILVFPPVISQLRLLIHKFIDNFYYPRLCSFSVGQEDDRRVIVGSTSRITRCSLPYACIHEKLYCTSKVLEKIADCICAQRIKLLLMQDSKFASFMSTYESSRIGIENNETDRKMSRMKEENKTTLRDRLKRPDKQLYVPRALRKTTVENKSVKNDVSKAGSKKLPKGGTSVKIFQPPVNEKTVCRNITSEKQVCQELDKRKIENDKTEHSYSNNVSSSSCSNIPSNKSIVNDRFVSDSAIECVKDTVLNAVSSVQQISLNSVKETSVNTIEETDNSVEDCIENHIFDEKGDMSKEVEICSVTSENHSFIDKQVNDTEKARVISENSKILISKDSDKVTAGPVSSSESRLQVTEVEMCSVTAESSSFSDKQVNGIEKASINSENSKILIPKDSDKVTAGPVNSSESKLQVTEVEMCSVTAENHSFSNKNGIEKATVKSENGKILISKDSDNVTAGHTNSSESRLQVTETSNTLVHDVLKDHQSLNGTSVQRTVEHACVSSENPEDSWETMFNDDGECLDPKFIKELSDITGRIDLTVAKSDYSDYQPVSRSMTDEYNNIVELYGFPVEFSTQDLTSAFSMFQEASYNIKWVDDCHALAIFSSPVIACQALDLNHPFIKVRPLSEGTKESKEKARFCARMFEVHKPRPVTSAALARRLVSGALGLKVNASKEQRDMERNMLREAREKKKLKAKQRQDIWNGIVS